jgi:hypothetical protein
MWVLTSLATCPQRKVSNKVPDRSKAICPWGALVTPPDTYCQALVPLFSWPSCLTCTALERGTNYSPSQSPWLPPKFR